MRFRALRLHAFGPFTGHSLDLGGGAPGGLHVIFGPNEAGKSTALRAVHDLLFGIPERTADAHLHPTQELKLGALLEGEDGSLIEVVRRKRRKDSLRDPSDAPIDEAVLGSLLGGVDAGLFVRLFGLDHERLREAGEDMLSGKGDVGESLFDAAGGGRGIRALLEQLERRAEELFKPRSQKAKLNALLEAYAEAKRQAREATRPPDRYLEQRAAVERAENERERLRGERRTLREEEHRLKRIRGNLPRLSEREACREKLADLGEIRAVPADCRKLRSAAEQGFDTATREIERCRREIERRQARLSSLEIPESILELGSQDLQELSDGVGQTRKAMLDLPRLRASSRAAEDDARAILRRLGHDIELHEAERLRLGSAELGRLRRLGEQRPVLLERKAQAERLLYQIEQDIARARQKLDALAEARDPMPLEVALRKARAAGDLDQRLRERALALAALLERADERLAALGFWQGPLAALVRLAVPAVEAATVFDAEQQAIADKKRLATDEARKLLNRIDDIARQIRALEGAGEVPSEAELLRCRARRQEGLAEVLRAWRERQPLDVTLPEFDAERPLAKAFEHAIQGADEVADRLRREASRVAELASLRAAREHDEGLRQRLLGDLAELETTENALHERWTSAWAPAAIRPAEPSVMRAWLERRRELVELSSEIDAERRAIEVGKSEQGLLRQALERAIDERQRGNGEDLVSLALLAEEQLSSIAKQAERARDLEERAEALQAKRNEAKRELDQHGAAIERWTEDWALAVEPLGQGKPTAPEEVALIVSDLGDFFKKLDEMKREQKRVLGIERDAQVFSELVTRHSGRHAPDLAGQPADAAAEILVKRHDKAQHDHDERTRLAREIAELAVEVEELTAQRVSAERALSELMNGAGASSASELAEFEARAAEAEALKLELSRIESQLRDAAEGLSLEALIEEARGVDRASLAARLEELKETSEKSDDEFLAADREVASLAEGLKHYSERQAADAAQELEVLAAEIRRHAVEYATASLSCATLRREIEHYRERNQGPVLRRAQALFTRLTLSRYAALRVGLEESVLLCVLADGKEVGVSELSEGTRYQLYLALRIASIERYLEHNAPLPLILDDVLIHFDDERARAALGVLSDLAERMQILFFTHHARDLELAKSAVAKTRLFEHVLPSRTLPLSPLSSSV